MSEPDERSEADIEQLQRDLKRFREQSRQQIEELYERLERAEKQLRRLTAGQNGK